MLLMAAGFLLLAANLVCLSWVLISLLRERGDRTYPRPYDPPSDGPWKRA